MIGAIIGDIVGSRFEWNNIKSESFELFTDINKYTDDTVMTCAIAQALMDWFDGNKKQDLSALAIQKMQEFGRLYPNAGYGANFDDWIWQENPLPYNSFGNGSAMRVSACGWVASSLEECIKLATKVSAVSHNHKEGIKGACATAVCIYLAKTKHDKKYIQNYIQNHYYDLNFKIDEIRPTYKYEISCQKSVPQAIKCFLEADNFEQTVKKAISLGGDSDTIGAIACSIAEAYYPIDDKISSTALSYLDDNLRNIVKKFNKYKKYN